MALCTRNSSDQLAQELVKHGINIILPPRDGIKPGALLLGEQDGSIRVADWKTVLGVDPRPREREEPTFEKASFSISNQLTAAAGASVVGRLLSSFGLIESGLNGALKRSGATQLNIKLTAPAVSAIDNIDTVLGALRRAAAISIPAYEDRRFFVVERVWRARGMSIALQNSGGTEIAFSAEAKAALQAGVKMEVADRGDGRMTFTASSPLIFGVTLRELIFGAAGLTDQAASDHMRFRGANDDLAFVTDDDLFTTWNEED